MIRGKRLLKSRNIKFPLNNNEHILLLIYTSTPHHPVCLTLSSTSLDIRCS